MYDDLLEDFKKIQGWFSPDLFYQNSMIHYEKLTMLQSLLHEYAKAGLLKAKKVDGMWCFIHPNTHTKRARDIHINHLLNGNEISNLVNSEISIPLSKVTTLGMIDGCRLNLSQLKQKLDYEDERKVKKWLDEHGIPIRKDGREKVVYEFNVDLAIQLEIVQELKQQYPDKWFQIYAANSSCEKMTNTVFEIYPAKASVPNKTKEKTQKIFLK